mgnify:CR=1 FL=1
MIDLEVAGREYLLRERFSGAVVVQQPLLERLGERLAPVDAPGLDIAGIPEAIDTNLAASLCRHPVPGHGDGDARLLHVPGNPWRVVIAQVVEVLGRALAMLDPVVNERAGTLRSHLVAQREYPGINVFTSMSSLTIAQFSPTNR